MKIRVEGPSLPGALQQSMAKAAKTIHAGMVEAADAASQAILIRGRADIKGAGRFGARWTEGLTTDIEDQPPKKVTITIKQAVPYWTVFQEGAVIYGKPLLWIPLSFAVEAQGVRARDFPGRLFRVDRKSGEAPLLLSVDDGQPKYFGKESVTIPKKFQLVEICHDVAGQLGRLYWVSIGR